MQPMKQHWQTLLIVAAIFLLWNTPLMIPLKILIVFFHELSHGLAALLTGGSIESISVSPQQGGLTVTRGGWLFFITSAGYLGSLLIGVLLYLAALNTKADKLIMGALGATMLLVAALYMRELFALGFTIAAGAAMLLSAKYLPENINDAALRVFGLVSMGYVPFDILSDTILRSNLRSDAYNLSTQTYLPTVFWGGLWLLISLVVIFYTFKRSQRASR
ncbi:MAG: M50 family metallopeptidase [Rhodobacteraceae bacterium]|nr:M50 family metallopeptidase [Paracoccaceae bacterium]